MLVADEIEVSTVAVVDDEPESRKSLGWVLTDSELRMLEVQGPLQTVNSAVEQIFDRADALICDHHLEVRNYASFSGAELVAAANRAGRIAVLCTRYMDSDVQQIRPFMADIPVLRRPDELNEPDELRSAFQACVKELKGYESPLRKLWRAQLVVERIDGDVVDVSIPSWEVESTIRLQVKDIPEWFRSRLLPGERTFGWVNLGAPSADLLFVGRWGEE